MSPTSASFCSFQEDEADEASGEGRGGDEDDKKEEDHENCGRPKNGGGEQKSNEQ
jgi:hypothetical protein